MQRQHQHQQKVHHSQSATTEPQFLFEPANPRMKNTNTQRSSHTSQSATMQQQQQWDSTMGTERLTSLHAKLHQEADKIRKWKVQTEMDMKHRDKQLTEATMTVESLRRSILELQLENENLSTKLQDELSSREETLQRVLNTREMINILRNQEEKLEQKLSSCETERTELKYLEKEHAKQFEDMVYKFKQLQMEAKETREMLLQEIHEEKEQKKQLETELQQKIEVADNQIKSMCNKIDEKDIALRDVHVILLKNEEKLHATDKDLGAAQQKVSSLSETLSSREQELNKFKTECALLQTEKEQLATELVEERERLETARQQEDSVQEALNNSVAIFNQRQTDMQRDIDRYKAELAEEQKRLKEVRSRLADSLMYSESLKSSRDVLMLEKTEMEFCLEKLKHELTVLQTDKYKNKEEISSLEAEVESLTSQLEQEQRKAARLQVQVDEVNPRYSALEKEKKHIQQELEALKTTLNARTKELEQTSQAQTESSKNTQQLQEMVGQLQRQLSESTVELERVQGDLVNWQQQFSSKESEASSTGVQLQSVSSELVALSEEHNSAKIYIATLEDQINALGEEKVSLESRLCHLEQELESLQREREENGQVTEAERQNSTEKQEQLEQKLKDVNVDVKTKNKTIKEMEKELKTLRGKVTTFERKQEEKNREVDYLKQELASSEQTKEHTDKLIASLQTHLEQETNKANELAQKVDQLTLEATQAQNEKSDALAQCERQIIEMSATLEKYTNDHQKLLAQKDKEIEELRTKCTQLATNNQQNNNIVTESKSEIQQLNQKLTTLESELVKVQQEKTAESEVLKTQLEEQKKFVEELKENAALANTNASNNAEYAMEVGSPVVGATALPLLPTTPVAQVRAQGSDHLQRSILRQSAGSSKRRKVAFISPSVDSLDLANEDSESSIDLEVEEQLLSQSRMGPRTPLRLRQSPHTKGRYIGSTTLVFTPSKNSKLASAITSAAVARKPRQQVPQYNMSPQPTKLKEKAADLHKTPKTPNMRKAPMRTSKFFRSSPKERNAVSKKKEKSREMPTSWFDDDAVYGFGSED